MARTQTDGIRRRGFLRSNNPGPGGEEERAAEMAVMDTAFKALTAGLGVATLYLAGSFSFNVYRGLAWHSEQSKLEKENEKSQD